jgi:hypothetical protein
LGWLFYQGDAISEVLSWGGVLFTSAVAFVLPLYLAFKVTQKDDMPKGSLDVYGGIFTTRTWELRATASLLAVAVASVLLAILGQGVYDEEKAAVKAGAIQSLRNFTGQDMGTDSKYF